MRRSIFCKTNDRWTPFSDQVSTRFGVSISIFYFLDTAVSNHLNVQDILTAMNDRVQYIGFQTSLVTKENKGVFLLLSLSLSFEIGV